MRSLPVRRSTRLALLVSLVIVSPAFGHSTAALPVAVSKTSFNPSLGETVSIQLTLLTNAHVAISVLDRDGYVTRQLTNEPRQSGAHLFTWDGRDAEGCIVADEAYSFKVDVTSPTGHWSYFPAAKGAKTYAVQAKHYSRRNAALMYDLPSSSRVHAQAGSARIDAKSSTYDGPVLKTLVNREPRPAGAIVESWNGLDESGDIYVPDLRNFVTAILATELPENSVITYGNKSRTFADVATKRSGTSLLPAPGPATTASHDHHRGLTALEDVSPVLLIEPLNARWDAAMKAWQVSGAHIRVSVTLAGPSAHYVARQPGKIVTFVDYSERARRALNTRAAKDIAIELPRDGAHVISINWQSDYGPVAANSIRVVRQANKNATH